MSPLLHPLHPIMIVDDEEQVIQSTELVLRSAGYTNFHGESDPRAVLEYLEENQVELVLLDLAMPHIHGEQLLMVMQDLHPDVPVVILTSAGDLDTAVRCMRLGAVDYMVKPFEKPKLVNLVDRLNDIRELRRENFKLRDHMVGGKLSHPEAFENIVTQDENMIGIFKYLEASAESAQPILICGETGVGKELFARAVHEASGRRGPFIAVNLAGLDEQVFSDTLFGHRKGAFTGADQVRQGLVKQAEGGTLFLDEIGDLPQQSQIKLLRLLQEREYFPLGADLPQRSETRIVMATNVDLIDAEHKGLFRKDLYYRISTHRVTVPPLRDRSSDIPFLLDRFVRKAAEGLGKPVPRIPAELPALLQTYVFPGNVRELEAMVFEAVTQSNGTALPMKGFKTRIGERESGTAGSANAGVPGTSGRSRAENGKVPLGGELSAAGVSPDAALRVDAPAFPTLKDAENWLIKKAMERAGNNQGVAAAYLGISRQTLNTKLKTLAG